MLSNTDAIFAPEPTSHYTNATISSLTGNYIIQLLLTPVESGARSVDVLDLARVFYSWEGLMNE